MSLITFLDLAGIVVFAISGAIAAGRNQMDLLGFMLIGTITGIGGGTFRDIVLGRLPVFWIEDPLPLILCLVPAFLTFWVMKHVHRRRPWLLWADALGLAVFSVTGTQAALSVIDNPWLAGAMGMVTATFGGFIRDVILREEPLILHREIYAVAALLGGLCYSFALTYEVPATIAVISGVLVCFILRIMGFVYNLSLPHFSERSDPDNI